MTFKLRRPLLLNLMNVFITVFFFSLCTISLRVTLTPRGRPEALSAPPAFLCEKNNPISTISLIKGARRKKDSSYQCVFLHAVGSSPCNRCHLGDPERGSGRPPRRHAAALLLPGRVQHPAAPSAGRRLQPLCLAREEQVPQQQRPSQRGAARSERTFTTQLCGSSSK